MELDEDALLQQALALSRKSNEQIIAEAKAEREAQALVQAQQEAQQQSQQQPPAQDDASMFGDVEDEELQRALAMSMQDSEPQEKVCEGGEGLQAQQNRSTPRGQTLYYAATIWLQKTHATVHLQPGHEVTMGFDLQPCSLAAQPMCWTEPATHKMSIFWERKQTVSLVCFCKKRKTTSELAIGPQKVRATVHLQPQ
eukprot:scaffold88200_cov20-Tisochrysis_lutea.AAC.1